MKVKFKFVILFAALLTSAFSEDRSDRNMHMNQKDPAQNPTIYIGQPISLDSHLDDTLRDMPVAGKSGRYTIGARSITIAIDAIQRLKNGQDLSQSEQEGFLICVAAMLRIENNPQLIEESNQGHMSPSENKNVEYYKQNDDAVFIGYNDLTAIGQISFSQLKEAYTLFKSRYISQSAQVEQAVQVDNQQKDADRSDRNMPMNQKDPVQNPTIYIGQPISLDSHLDDTLRNMPVAGNGPVEVNGARYTIGARSISIAIVAIQRLKNGQELSKSEQEGFLICVAAMLRIENNPQLIEKSTQGYMFLSENKNVGYNKQNGDAVFIGYNASTVIGQISFSQLKEAYDLFKSRYISQSAQVGQAVQVDNQQKDIENFLAKKGAELSQEEINLINIGNRRLTENGPLNAKYNNDISGNGLTSGRFRGHYWVEEMFNMTEYNLMNQIKENLRNNKISVPQPWSVEKIDIAYKKIAVSKKNPTASSPMFKLVQGVGVSGLHYSKFAKNAIVQLASQFNYLESPNKNVTLPSQYPFDRSQGPLGAIEAAIATYIRHVSVETDQLPHALHNIISTQENYIYFNGYFTPNNAQNKNELARKIHENLNKLEVLAQWVVNEASKTNQIHVFSAAPSYQYSYQPSINSDEGQICLDLVAAQYEAIAKLAAIRSVKIGEPVNLHLTLVGQGVFNNPAEVMAEAFKRVATVVKGFNVNVFVHLYSGSDLENFKTVNRENIDTLFGVQQMSAEEFMHQEEQPAAAPAVRRDDARPAAAPAVRRDDVRPAAAPGVRNESDRVENTEGLTKLLKILNSKNLNVNQSTTNKVKELLRLDVTNDAGLRAMRKEAETQQNDFSNNNLYINDYWDRMLRTALKYGLRNSWMSLFWLGEGQEPEFMKKLATNPDFLASVLSLNNIPMFRYSTQFGERYNVTPLTFIAGLLSVFREKKNEILQIDPSAQDLYDGIIQQIDKLSDQVEAVDPDEEVEDVQTIATSNSAIQFYNSAPYKNGNKSFEHYYKTYYIPEIRNFNKQPFTKDQIKTIVDNLGLSGFFTY